MPNVISVQRNSGFTLVELMVVVAMVGILSTIAIPNYYHFVARARQAEAKVDLAAVYASEKAFFVENGSYTYCLRQAGFEPENGKRYYSVGASTYNRNVMLCGPTGDNDCTRYNFSASGSCGSSSAGCCNALTINFAVGWPFPVTISDYEFIASVSADTHYIPLYDVFVGPSVGGLGLETQVTQNTFTIGAAGCIYPINAPNYWSSPVPSAIRSTAHAPAAYDGWTIDQDKTLINPYPGF